jgi:hypothetical protein
MLRQLLQSLVAAIEQDVRFVTWSTANTRRSVRSWARQADVIVSWFLTFPGFLALVAPPASLSSAIPGSSAHPAGLFITTGQSGGRKRQDR